jgi:mono/diheme cytochrome c family protein
LTEIPEHLLKRSKAAKGGKSGDDGGSSAPEASSSAPVPAQSAAPAPAAADLPNLDPPPPPPKPVPAFVQAGLSRKKIPVWVLPVIAALPLWALSFAGTMQQPESEDILLIEGEIFYSACAGCHGGNGGGGVGYQLSDGEVLKTFPEVIDMLAHVARGSDAILGEQYGDPNRDGGAHVSGARGQGPMPAQTASLNLVELEIVVFHERAILSGEDTSSEAYQEWMESMRERWEGGEDEPIDLDLLLACANPEYTPGATGTGSPDPENHPCPGPHGGDEVMEEAAG